MGKTDFSSLPLSRLERHMTEALGQPSFRAGQVYRWLHGRQAGHFQEMTDLPAPLRRALEETAFVTAVRTRLCQESAKDGSQKYLLEMGDGNCVEAVLMRHRHGESLCISTQAGCRMGCVFCASAQGGLARNLTAGEMLGEVYEVQRQRGKPVDSVVLMGIGEPLDNEENVLDFLEILSSPLGRNMSLRHVSLSTCGLADAIDRLALRRLGLTLSVSLHGADDGTRGRLMPVNRQYNIQRLMKSCKAYGQATGRRVSYEYALMEGINDVPPHAARLAELLAGQNCHVNLIPANPAREGGIRRSGKGTVRAFARFLEGKGIRVTVRRELGSDISAACGQLRRQAAVSGEGEGA
jgi:23S rRNA (adenine2503-C2)-methyltransferase